jgi:hypothetical protein
MPYCLISYNSPSGETFGIPDTCNISLGSAICMASDFLVFFNLRTAAGLNASGCRLGLGPGISDPDVACLVVTPNIPTLVHSEGISPHKSSNALQFGGRHASSHRRREFCTLQRDPLFPSIFVPLCLRQINNIPLPFRLQGRICTAFFNGVPLEISAPHP